MHTVVHIAVVIITLVGASLQAPAQRAAVKRVLGTWSMVDNATGKQHILRLSGQGDSLSVELQDEYGNYTSTNRRFFSIEPTKAGPKGILFEKSAYEVDSDGDTTDVTTWMKFEDLNKQRVKVSIGTLQQLRTRSMGPFDSWPQSFRDKHLMIIQSHRGLSLIHI